MSELGDKLNNIRMDAIAKGMKLQTLDEILGDKDAEITALKAEIERLNKLQTYVSVNYEHNPYKAIESLLSELAALREKVEKAIKWLEIEEIAHPENFGRFTVLKKIIRGEKK